MAHHGNIGRIGSTGTKVGCFGQNGVGQSQRRAVQRIAIGFAGQNRDRRLTVVHAEIKGCVSRSVFIGIRHKRKQSAVDIRFRDLLANADRQAVKSQSAVDRQRQNFQKLQVTAGDTGKSKVRNAECKQRVFVGCDQPVTSLPHPHTGRHRRALFAAAIGSAIRIVKAEIDFSHTQSR